MGKGSVLNIGLWSRLIGNFKLLYSLIKDYWKGECVFRRIRTPIPAHSGHPFQSKADTYSKAKRTPIPEQSGHPQIGAKRRWKICKYDTLFFILLATCHLLKKYFQIPS